MTVDAHREALLDAACADAFAELVTLPLAALQRVAALEAWPSDVLTRVIAAAAPALRRQHDTVMRAALEAAVDRRLTAENPTLH